MTKTATATSRTARTDRTEPKREGFFLNVSDEEKLMIRTLREKHAINVSQLIRNAIHDAYQARQGDVSPLAVHPKWPGHQAPGGEL